MPPHDTASAPRPGGPRTLDPPRHDLLPVAVRSALLASGALVRCGPGVRGVGWPETPRVRAFALAPWLGTGLIATHMVAAWVWGAARSPGEPLQLSTVRGARRPDISPPDRWIRELRYPEHDLVHLGPFALTSPLRTACDLLRSREPFDVPRRAACRLLLQAVADERENVLAGLQQGDRASRRRALERFRRLSPR